MSKKIKTICPSCEKEFILDVNDFDTDDPVIAEMTLRLAAMVHCKSCSAYHESREALEKVRHQNNQTIWEQEERLAHLGKKSSAADKSEIKQNIKTAREDLLGAVKQIARLDDARALYLGGILYGDERVDTYNETSLEQEQKDMT